MAHKMYEIYKQVDDWSAVLHSLDFPKTTWYAWCEHFGFQLKQPTCGIPRNSVRNSKEVVHTIVPDGKGGTTTETKKVIVDFRPLLLQRRIQYLVFSCNEKVV
jgi:hypothetical protein